MDGAIASRSRSGHVRLRPHNVPTDPRFPGWRSLPANLLTTSTGHAAADRAVRTSPSTLPACFCSAIRRRRFVAESLRAGRRGNRIYSKKACQRRALNPALRSGSAERSRPRLRARRIAGASTPPESARAPRTIRAPRVLTTPMEIVRSAATPTPTSPPAPCKRAWACLTMVLRGFRPCWLALIMPAGPRPGPIIASVRRRRRPARAPSRVTRSREPRRPTSTISSSSTKGSAGTRRADSPGSAPPASSADSPLFRASAAAVRPAAVTGRESVRTNALWPRTSPRARVSRVDHRDPSRQRRAAVRHEEAVCERRVADHQRSAGDSKDESSRQRRAHHGDDICSTATPSRQINNDLLNFIANVDFPIVMLGRDRIIALSAPARSDAAFTPADIGRSIHEVKLQSSPHLERILAEVIVRRPLGRSASRTRPDAGARSGSAVSNRGRQG